jgi:hypothetical protein
VHLLADRGESRGGLWLVDGGSGEWRMAVNGGARGWRLIELAMLRWRVSWGKAGHRLAKAAGLRGVPVARMDHAA